MAAPLLFPETLVTIAPWLFYGGLVVAFISLFKVVALSVERRNKRTKETNKGALAPPMWLFRLEYDPTLRFIRRLIPLQDAARIAYAKTRGTKAALQAERRIAYAKTRGTKAALQAERPINNEAKVLMHYGHWLTMKGDIPVYGFCEPSRTIERIPNDRVRRDLISDDATRLTPTFKGATPYTGLAIERRDLRRKIPWIRSLGE